MRLGVIAPDVTASGWPVWADLASRADGLGIDAIYLRADGGGDPLLLAATLSARTSWLRVVAEVTPRAGTHPVHLAERICVADQCLGGRLAVVLRPAPAEQDAGILAETLAVLDLALASRPFAHQGQHWTIPARLPANDSATWSRLSVTPQPAQLELPIWLAGPDTAQLARRGGYAWVDEQRDGSDSLAGPARGRVRPALRRWSTGADGRPDPASTAAALSAERDRWGMNLAFLPLLADGADQLENLASRVRPRVQLAELPEGLTEFWEQTLPADSLER
jgi:alkanesulfonate monooxygenase SsuD/methylene tetrahydromethanopterin reductase-like flavin-dependent oxidoreductase (luciferase family)